MKLNAIPLEGVENVRFGMSREEVRNIWGEAREFFKTSDSEVPTDDFGFCHVYYDESDRCEGIEIFDDAQVYVQGQLIFPIDLNDFMEIFPGFSEDDDGPYSTERSIGIYAPDGTMESIMFAKEGYFDFLL